MIIRKNVFVKIGGFDERFFLYFEDGDLCRRMLECGYKIAVIRDLTVKHSRGGSARKVPWIMIKNSVVSAVKYFMKWHL